VTSLFFKKAIQRAGSVTTSGVRDVVVEGLSETAKKAFLGVPSLAYSTKPTENTSNIQ
jgi:hypothetical protein